MPVTQKEMAERLGVSRQLVSFALAGKPGVSAKVRENVRALALELGYEEHTNRSARLLAGRRNGRRAKSGIIALILPSPTSSPIRSHPFHSQLLDNIELEAEVRGLDVFICSMRNEGIPPLVRELGVDGLITMGYHAALQEAVRSEAIPNVQFFIESPGAICLMVDARRGVAQATEHLIELGHRRIAYMGHRPEFSNASERLAGYVEALQPRSLDIEDRLQELSIVSQSAAAGARGFDALLARDPAFARTGKPHFTGLVCYNDTLAMGAVERAEELGIRVPDDLSVVGFDDVSAAHGFRPALTSVSFDRAAMGRRAVELLCTEETLPVDYRETFPTHVEVRASSGVPRLE